MKALDLMEWTIPMEECSSSVVSAAIAIERRTVHDGRGSRMKSVDDSRQIPVLVRNGGRIRCTVKSRESARRCVSTAAASLDRLSRIVEKEVQSYSSDIPVLWCAGVTMLSPVIRLQHETAPIRQLKTPCVPFLVPGMLGAVIEKLGSAKRREANAVNKKINFGSHHVAIGGRVGSVDPTELCPVPVAQQQS